jgi:L-asparaginase / beta-aspartyl-peptidase
MMLRVLLAPAALLAVTLPAMTQTVRTAPQSATHKWSIVVHGGAGVIERKSMPPETEAEYRAAMKTAIETGAAVLAKGGTSLDAVQQTIQYLEDNPLFNAGKGAVFTADGRNELDSAIMDGATLKAGAVAQITRTRHPIAAARAVMEQSPAVMLAGPNADKFAASKGLEQVDNSYFFIERRWEGLIKQLQKEGKPIPQRPAGAPPAPAKPLAQLEVPIEPPDAHKWGTVGVVALDDAGNIAAGTSTGGLQAKLPGRIGDSPIIGAGTYASNHSCAVSGTGTGEYFIRLTIAREICALVEDKHMKLQAAADEVIHQQLEALHGDGGVIAIAPDGQAAWSFNTPGMYRARMSQGSQPTIAVYNDEP